MAIPIRSSRDIDAIRQAGRLVWSLIERALTLAVPGVTTGELARAIDDGIAAVGAAPILRGHSDAGRPAFPASVSMTLNEEVAFGLPGDRIVRDGDILTIDLALGLNGWCADAAGATVVGRAPSARRALLEGSLRAVRAGIAAIRPGVRWSRVAAAVRNAAAAEGLALVPGFGGHGVGRGLHEPPAAPFLIEGEAGQTPTPGQDFTLRPGMVLTVEPVFVQSPTAEPVRLVGADDGWTLLSHDRSPVCSQERTVAVTRSGPVVLAGPESPS